ncbi:MAG: HNH endonuclease [Acidimicrobiia bacterium]|nr:HNH endonuclease [Acidimicrobiia bacterium]NNL68434.1 DUF222 domain-containing protein [Acidimicrobiia bacterium]
MFDTDDRVLDHLPPGPALAALLAAIDQQDIPPENRVVVMRARQRLANHYAAAVYADMAAISDHMHDTDEDPHLAHDSAAAEIRTALRLTRRAADNELNLALDLRRRLPAVHRLLTEGLIDVRRARVIAHSTAHLTPAATQQVTAAVIDDAPNLTTGQLTARLRKLCIEHDPEDARERYTHASTQRRLTTEPNPDGTAHLLGLNLPPDQVQAATNHIDHLAKALRRNGETRTMDQLRADVFLDLLSGNPTTTGGTADIRVDLTTLVELTDTAGDLAGYGPVVADIARRVASEAAHWTYTATNPETRQAHTGTTRRRPTATQQRTVRSRDTTCVFPGCRMPATQTDLDHRIRYSDGGPTTPDNLAPLCRHDHRIKETGWTYHRLSDGTYQWTTKLGHTYTTGPSP